MESKPVVVIARGLIYPLPNKVMVGLAGVMLESSSAGESPGAGNAGSNLGDFNFPCY